MIPKARKKQNILLSRKLSNDTPPNPPEDKIPLEGPNETKSKNIEDAAKLVSEDNENTRKRPPWFGETKKTAPKM